MRFLILTFCFFITAAAAPFAAQAKTQAGIAVVVNDGAISYMDINNRMGLIIGSSGLPNTAETLEKLTPQVVNMLIEEQLQFQEAQRLGLSVSPAQIDAEFQNIAKSNKMSADQFAKILTQQKISVDSLRRQIEARLLWQEVFASTLRRQVRISNSDIESYIQRLENHVGQTEYLLSEIFLPVDDPAQDKATKQLAQKVLRDIAQKKAPFAAVAQQISKAPGAQKGGILGWIPGDQLDPDVQKVIKTMQPKSLSNPIRTLDGYHIYYLSEVRTIKEENIPPRDEVEKMLTMQRAERVGQNHLQSLRRAAFIDNRLKK